LRWVLLAAALIVLAVLLPICVSVPGPAVRHVFVHLPSGSHLSAREVRAATVPAAHRGFFGVNLAAVQRHVEALAWVKRAEVRRMWPDALAIAITPRRAMARWGKHALVDDTGEVFAPASVSGFAGLPRLSGPKADAAALFDDYERARAALAAIGLRPAALSENPRGGVTVALADATRIQLGSKDPRVKLARFVAIAAPALGTALARAATVDMRYANGFAVGWKKEGKHG
jgi:cell division protein FtsQ